MEIFLDSQPRPKRQLPEEHNRPSQEETKSSFFISEPESGGRPLGIGRPLKAKAVTNRVAQQRMRAAQIKLRLEQQTPMVENEVLL